MMGSPCVRELCSLERRNTDFAYSSRKLATKATKTRVGMFFFQFFVTAIGVIYQIFVEWLYSVTIKLLKEGSQ